MKRITAILLVIVMAFSLAACSQGKDKSGDLAKVGETVITEKQLSEYMALMGYLQGMDFTKIPKESLDGVKGVLLGNMVQMEALEQYYKDSKALPPTAKEDLKKFIADSKAQESISKFLTENDISDETLTNFFYSQFYTEAFFEEIKKEIPNFEKESQAYYEKNKEQYKEEQVRASHILFKEKDKATAEKVLKELQNGADFATMAKKYGTDGTKDLGGDLNYFGRGQMVKEFEDAAFALEKGQLSELVKTQHGYHIIKLTDKRDYVPYEEVKNEIDTTLTEPNYNKKIDKILKDLGVEYFTKIKPVEPKAEAQDNADKAKDASKDEATSKAAAEKPEDSK